MKPFNQANINGTQLRVVPSLEISIQEAKERMEHLEEYVRETMVKGVDYGVIEGYNKPSLFKPGAEKLCDAFGLSKRFDVIHRTEDWEKGIFYYEVKATLISKSSSMIEAEGIGSCNSKENQYAGNDPFASVNTIIKMAKKRALVDAVLSATRSSSIFTQDIEELGKRDPIDPMKNNSKISKTTLKKIFQLSAELNLESGKMKKIMWKHYNVSKSTDLTNSEGFDLITRLLIHRQKIQLTEASR